MSRSGGLLAGKFFFEGGFGACHATREFARVDEGVRVAREEAPALGFEVEEG